MAFIEERYVADLDVVSFTSISHTVELVVNMLFQCVYVPFALVVDRSISNLISPEDEAVFNFGKYKGLLLRDIAKNYPDYLQWIYNRDFSIEVKQIAMNALVGEFPEPLESL